MVGGENAGDGGVVGEVVLEMRGGGAGGVWPMMEREADDDGLGW